jgi:hypothetical protein
LVLIPDKSTGIEFFDFRAKTFWNVWILGFWFAIIGRPCYVGMILRGSSRMLLARKSHPARANHEPPQNGPLGDNWHNLAVSLRLPDLAIMATRQNGEVIGHFAVSNARDGNVR